MIAANERGRQRTNPIDDRVGVGAISDQIAEHERMIVRTRSREHCVERLEIGMNVADDEIPQKSIHSRMRSTISGTGREASIRTCA